MGGGTDKDIAVGDDLKSGYVANRCYWVRNGFSLNVYVDRSVGTTSRIVLVQRRNEEGIS